MHECNEQRCYGWQDNRKMQNMWKTMHARGSQQIEKLSRMCQPDIKFLDGSRSGWKAIETKSRNLDGLKLRYLLLRQEEKGAR